MPAWEAVQIASGLLIPLLLIGHIANTRLAAELLGTNDYYTPVLLHYWPAHGIGMALLIGLAWSHACIGLHFWLRLHRGYRRVLPVLVPLAVALPILAYTGHIAGGREAATRHASPAARADVQRAHGWPDDAGRAQLDRLGSGLLGLFGGFVGLVALFRLGRTLRERREPMVAVKFSGHGVASGVAGSTVLEIARSHGVPLTSVCGGRARCSTCRVRVDAAAPPLPHPQMAEAVTLGAVGAGEGVRLACQLRPAGPITVTRLVLPRSGHLDRIAEPDDANGIERDLAVLFLDLRGFTTLSENRLPYDVVFLLNQFFRRIGEAIAIEGGWIDKYMGDGLLAVFGRESGLAAGARSALAAAARIDRELDGMNAELIQEFGRTIDVGMGLHCGPMVVGRIGHPDTATITVVGRTVNTASRLEGLAKERGCQLVVSRDVIQAAGRTMPAEDFEMVVVRGLSAPIAVITVARARSLVGPRNG
jgi:adenylate cyclase